MVRRRAIVYNPSIHVLGGAERYQFAMAEALRADWDVTLAGVRVPSAEELGTRGFPIDLPMQSVPYQQFPEVSSGFDLAVVVANAPPSYPSAAAHSALAVMFPTRSPIGFRHPRAAVKERRALRSYDEYVPISEFTQEWTRRRWRRSGEIIYPPVELGSYDPARKERSILAIGRFYPYKGQLALVEAFRSLPRELRAEWRLVLVGGTTQTAVEERHLERVRQAARGHNIEVRPNAPASEVQDLLASATLFWHGAGYGRSADRPEDAEHFGISIVEAMSWGAVPLVFADGGAVEFVDDRNGALWTTVPGLVADSVRLMGDPASRAMRSRRAVVDARRFGLDAFRAAVRRRFP